MKIYKFKPKHEKNALFAKVLLAVGALQVALLLLLGGLIIKEIMPPQEAVEMIAAPQMDDKALQDRIKDVIICGGAKKRTSNMSIPIAVAMRPEISEQQSFTVNIPEGGFSNIGGIGENFVINSADLSVSKMDFDTTLSIGGLPMRSDSVFIAFEVSEEVMRDDMGGFDAFNIIKDEIKSLVESLPATVVFNVMAFDAHHKILYHTSFPNLVQANPTNKAAFAKWMDSINPDTENIGLKWNSPREYKLRYPQPAFPQISFHYDGHHKWEVAGRYGVYQAAIESKAGAVWILTRAWPEPANYYMSLTPELEKRYTAQWEKNIKDFERGGKTVASDEDYRNWIKSTDAARKKAREWLENENKRRESKGVPKRVITDMLALANELKIPHPPKPTTKNDLRPPVPKFKTYKRNTLFAAYEPILKRNYDENNLPRPRVNLIMLTGRKDEANSAHMASVNSWSKLNSGGSRILRAGRPVSEYN